MKHNLLKSVIISVILALTCTGSIYAADITSNGSAILFFNKEAVSWWDSDNAVMSAYFFKDSNNKFAGVAKQYSGNIYYVVIPSGTWSTVILTRHSNGTTTPSWDNKWNQTGNITLQTDQNYISAFSDGSNSATFGTQKPTSAASLSASESTIYTGSKTTITPSLTSYTTYNEIKSTSYSISPTSGASISNNKFTATTPGTYTITATITYNPKGYNNLTSTTTATKTITVKDPTFVVRGGVKFGDTWESNTHVMTKNNASEKIVYYTFTIDGTNKIDNVSNIDFQFKIYEKELGKWYGLTAGGEQYWYTRNMGAKSLDGNNTGKNIEIRADVKGQYEIKVDYSDINAPKITVTYPQKPYYLSGAWDNWVGESPIENAPVTIHLGKGKYAFLIFNYQTDAEYYGNTGEMIRTNCSGWTMTNRAGDCHIEADITGDYIFTFDKSTKKLTVTYPDYSTKTIYLNINEQPTWVADYAKMAVRYDDTNYDMTPIGCDAKGHYLYSCDNVPIEKNIQFVRINPNNTSEIWNESPEYAVPVGNNLNCFKMTDWGTGNWGTFEEIYPVTLDPHANFKDIDFGSYSVRYNGTTYTSKPTETVTFYAPAGAQIEILEGDPINDAYYARVRAQAGAYNSIYGDNIAGYAGQTITVCGRTGFDNEFLTRASHVVYLGVPNTGDTFKKWRDTGYRYFIWLKDCPNGGLKENTGNPFTIGSTTYYKFEIPAGNRNFEFQRKVNNDGGSPYVHTIDFPYEIPTTNVNCFTLTSENDGYWDILPTQEGDYRLLYVEQVVEKDADGYTVIRRKKAHPSDIIRKGTDSQIVSLHTYKARTYTANAGGESTYESSNNPEIILQKYLGNDVWEDVECQMVYGPIETIPVMGQLPGRKNASSNSTIDDLKLHNGIKNIKNDDHPDKGNGVWNFVVTQDNAGNASVQWDQTHRYEGKYYIRTDVANGGWNNYTAFDNYMTYSQYAKDHSGFSHYFCRWVEKNITPNTKFVIANDYGIAISDTLAQDDYTNEHGDIAHDANIRWSWNEATNEIARAYIQGTWKAGSPERNRNLVVNYKSSSSAAAVEDLLDDSGDWIYQKDFTVKVGSHLNSLTAQYPVSTGSIQTFASNLDMLTGDPAANDNEYTVRILYDFKINKTLVALVPDNGKSADIAIDVIIERVDQGEATQVRAQVNATRTEGSTVYAVMSFTKNHITGASGASKYAKQFYWISFPFNVRVSDVFGFGEYGKHWIIQWYDGEERAKNGCWVDSPTFWRFQTDTTDYVLEAGKGYVLTLDLAEMDVFTNTTQVSLYFPSRNTVQTVNDEIIQDLNEITLDPYTCTIQRNDRYIKDSHWHMLGVPSYANKNKTFTQDKVAYFYQYNSENDTYIPTSSGSFNFNSMFSYMVQFAGTINWSEFAFDANGSQGLAAKRNTDNANDKHVLRLELQKNNASVDQTFVQLQAEEATEMFDMNLDLTKMVNSGNNIYSLIPGTESNIEVAANAMPIAETIIPLGVVSAAAGEYTFAMPDGTDGITVELIDYETNTRTNMLLDEYTVNLGKGTFETRFALHVKPDKTATGVENITTPSHSDVRKFIIDGILYMQKDGALYDAQGHIVR